MTHEAAQRSLFQTTDLQTTDLLPTGGPDSQPPAADVLYGVVTRALPAPAPHRGPLGAEALLAPGQRQASAHLRRAANRAARLALEHPEPDPEALRRYTGGGGLGESADEFYTPARVAELMWTAVCAVPGKEGAPLRVLDPACGSGHLLARAPQGTLLTGVEYDQTSAAVARALLPHAHIETCGFEQFHLACAEAPYDRVIVNPPYGPRSLRALHRPDVRLNEEYFSLVATERCLPLRGLCVLLVPAAMTHNDSQAPWRADLLRRGLVVFASLLPAGTFSGSGADVTTALLVVRRHDVGVQRVLETLSDVQVAEVLRQQPNTWNGTPRSWIAGTSLYTQTTERAYTAQGVVMVPRFEPVRTPGGLNLLGDKNLLRPGQFATMTYPGDPDLTDERLGQVRAHMEAVCKDPPVTLGAVLGSVRLNFGDAAFRTAEATAEGADDRTVPLGTRSPDGRCVLTEAGWTWSDDLETPAARAALDLAAGVARFAENSGQPGDAKTHLSQRLRLLEQDRACRLAHGPYQEDVLKRSVARFPALALLLSHLEDGILTLPERPDLRPEFTGTPAEIARALADLDWLNEAALARHANVTPAQAASLLTAQYCYAGNDLWQAPGRYYSGNAYEKSEAARTLAASEQGVRRQALLQQADELLRRLPDHADQGDVPLSPRDPVVPVDVLEAWVNDHLGSFITDRRNGAEETRPLLAVSRTPSGVRLLLIASQDRQENLAARQRLDEGAVRMLSEYLNFSTPLDTRLGTARPADEAEEQALRAATLELACRYEERLRQHFHAWLHGSAHQQRVNEAYNRAYRSELISSGDDGPLDLPGYDGPALHGYQNAAVRMFAASTGMIDGSDTGLGKSLVAICTAALLRRQGRSVRPAIVTPASVVGTMYREARRAFPAWRVTCIGMSPVQDAQGNVLYKRLRNGEFMLNDRQERIERWRPDRPQEKKLKFAAIAAGQTDLVILSNESFKDLPLQDETLEHLIRTDPQLEARRRSAGRLDLRARQSLHEALKASAAQQGRIRRRMRVTHAFELNFEALGLDALFYDEAHRLRNTHALPTTYGGETPRFLGAGQESQRAIDALYKARLTRQRGGRTYAMTASWLWNSLLDAPALMALVSDDLGRIGMQVSETVMERYVATEPRILIDTDGEVRVHPAVTGLHHLAEFRRGVFSVVRVRSRDDADVVQAIGRHALPTLRRVEHLIDMTPEQQAHCEEIKRFAARPADTLTPEERKAQHPFALQWQMRKLCIDPALLGVAGPNPRFEAITRQALATRARGEKTLIFLSVGESGGSLQRLKDTLIGAGYPENELAVITGSTHHGSLAQQDLADDYNYGDITLLLGTDVIREGMNLQHNTGSLLHGDLTWNRQGMVQRDGRGCRQGNVLPEVRSEVFLMRGSFDGVMYTVLKGKENWERQVRHGQADSAAFSGDLSSEELALMLSANPEETSVLIAAQRQTLRSGTARAIFFQHLQTLHQAWMADAALQHLRYQANRRRHAWTPADHRRVEHARLRAQQARSALETAGAAGFSFSRMIDHAGGVVMSDGLPVHAGMEFTLAGERYRVFRCDKDTLEATSVVNGAAPHVVFEYHRVTRQGQDFTPTADETAYRRVRQDAAPDRPAVLMDDGAEVLTFRAGQVNPKPKDQSVITLSVPGQGEAAADTRSVLPEDLSGASEVTLRRRLAAGDLLIHYKTLFWKAGLQITQVVVIFPVGEPVTPPGDAALTARLREMLAQWMSGETPGAADLPGPLSAGTPPRNASLGA